MQRGTRQRPSSRFRVSARIARPLLAAMLLLCMAAPARADGVPPERLARLAKGVNLSHWFWIPHDDSDRGRERFLSGADVDALKTAGITHVRLPVEPGWLWDGKATAGEGEQAAATLNTGRLGTLKRSMEMITSRGVAVVLDVHPARTEWFPRFTDESVERLCRFWGGLAAAVAETDPDLVFLELVNEPHGLRDPAAWNGYQRRLLRILRSAAPAHTIICTGDSWGGIDGLLRCEPVADRNVVYSFHFYDPHNFTHQGAEWGFDGWRHLRDVPYPATKQELEAVAAKLGSPRGREVLRWSASDPDPANAWNAEAVEARIAAAAEWGRTHGVPLYCGEFGVYRRFAPTDSRERWLRDVVASLETRGIGWAMWDYAGGFSLLKDGPTAVRRDGGERELDAATLRALGLTE